MKKPLPHILDTYSNLGYGPPKTIDRLITIPPKGHGRLRSFGPRHDVIILNLAVPAIWNINPSSRLQFSHRRSQLSRHLRPQIPGKSPENPQHSSAFVPHESSANRRVDSVGNRPQLTRLFSGTEKSMISRRSGIKEDAGAVNHASSRHTDDAEMPSSCAIALIEFPSVAIAAMRSRFTTSRGRPPILPALRALANPANVRSTINSRSKTAIAARTFISSREAGLPWSVSIPCVIAMNRTPRLSSSWTEATKCGIDRPNRSIFQTGGGGGGRLVEIPWPELVGELSIGARTPKSTWTRVGFSEMPSWRSSPSSRSRNAFDGLNAPRRPLRS